MHPPSAGLRCAARPVPHRPARFEGGAESTTRTRRAQRPARGETRSFSWLRIARGRQLQTLLPCVDRRERLLLVGDLLLEQILPLLRRLVLIQDLLRLQLGRRVAPLRFE